jgi:hypothetical protein
LVAILADDREVEKALHRLVAHLRAAGARIADGLVIKYAAGALSIEAPAVRHGEVLIRLPQNCLVPLSAFRLALAGDEIVLSSPRSGLSEATVAITETMFEIYNLAGKVRQHRKTSPWSLIAAHPDLLSYVAPPSRDDFPFSAKDLSAGNDAKVMLASFLHSRLFSHERSEQEKPSPVLLPITDFFNHHWRGQRYTYGARQSVVMRRSEPVAENGHESFASYGLHDAYDTWITYGFLDEDVPFVQSLPVTVKLPGVGTIRLGDVSAHDGSETEPSMDDVPPILARKGNRLRVGAVVIPGPQAPRALRRGLRALIGKLGAPRRRLGGLVLQAEEQILDANLTYYTELKSCLEGLSAGTRPHRAIRATFIRLCDQQIARLRAYIDYAAA